MTVNNIGTGLIGYKPGRKMSGKVKTSLTSIKDSFSRSSETGAGASKLANNFKGGIKLHNPAAVKVFFAGIAAGGTLGVIAGGAIGGSLGGPAGVFFGVLGGGLLGLGAGAAGGFAYMVKNM